MSNRLRRMLLAAGICLLTAAAAGEEAIDRIVAVVDEEIILESEVFQHLQFNVGSQVDIESLSAAEIDSFKNLILDELINQKVLLAKARADTIEVLQREVDRELDNRIKALGEQVGGQERLEEYYGMPLARIKRQFRPIVEEGMLIDKVRRNKLADVRVNHSDVVRFWETYRDSIPPLRDAIRISHILLKDSLLEDSRAAAVARADSARAEILRGVWSFEEYASRFSEDAGTASKGGLLGQTSRGDLVPEYERAAYELELDGISEPVVSPFGVHLIKLNERIGEKINTSHILFKIVPAEADMQRTMTFGDSLAKAARAGRDFADLVKEYSLDATTMARGGDLGWFSPAELPPDFQKPLEGLKEGDVTDAFRSEFGVHVVKVTGRVFAREVTLEEDYSRIEQMALSLKQDQVFQDWIKELAAETYIERK